MSSRPTQFASKTGVRTTSLFLCFNDDLDSVRAGAPVQWRSVAAALNACCVRSTCLLLCWRGGGYPVGVSILHVEYAERAIEYRIPFIFSLFCEYMHLECTYPCHIQG